MKLRNPLTYTFNSLLAASSTFITVAGFIVQFIGLRALHWSATVIQLADTFGMICIRAWVRRGLAESPKCISLVEDQEIACLALLATTPENLPQQNPTSRIQGKDKQSNFARAWKPLSREPHSHKHSKSKSRYMRVRGWELYTGIRFGGSQLFQRLRTQVQQFGIRREPYTINDAVKTHMELQNTIGRPTDNSTWSTRLCVAVEEIMKHIQFSRPGISKLRQLNLTRHLSWTIDIVRTRLDGPSSWRGETLEPLTTGLILQEQTNTWAIDRNEINSIIALWTYSLHERQNLRPAAVRYRWFQPGQGDVKEFYTRTLCRCAPPPPPTELWSNTLSSGGSKIKSIPYHVTPTPRGLTCIQEIESCNVARIRQAGIPQILSLHANTHYVKHVLWSFYLITCLPSHPRYHRLVEPLM